MEGDDKDFYYVEKILKKQNYPSVRYLVKWEGYDYSQSTWEPAENLINVPELILEFEQREREREINRSLQNSSKNDNDSSLNNDDNEENVNKQNKSWRQEKLKKNAPMRDDCVKRCLDVDQIPETIVTAKMIEGEIYCLTKFKERSDGIIPKDCYILSEELSNKFPDILIDFYESKIKFT